MNCSPQEHAAIKSRVAYFLLETDGHQKWGGLLTGQCKLCRSTLALQCCMLCQEPCETGDALPWGPEDCVAHFGCVARVMLATAKTRFVIIAGKTTAREFCETARDTDEEFARRVIT